MAAATLKTRTAALSIASNSALIAVKVAAGLATGSVAIISEAVHSFLDLMASLMAWVAVRVSDHPPDYDHPFGHGRAENLAALFEALLIVAGGVLIARESVAGLVEGKTLPSLKAGLLVMLLSTVVNLLISRHIFKVGKAVGSPALEADAWHLRTDVWTSLGIFLALSAIEIGRLVNPAWRLDFIDPACALAVSLLIVKTGASLGWDSVSTLIDNRLSPKELLLISDHIQAFYPRVLSYRRLRTRRAGPFRMVIVDLVVDGRLPVATAHALGQEVVMSICRHFPGADVTFHLEPSGHDDPVDAGGGPSPGDPTGGLARPRSEIKADLRTDFGDDLDVKPPAKAPRPEAGRPPSDRTGAASEAASGAPGAAPSDVTSGTSSVASSDAPADASVPGGGAAAPGSGSDEPERGGPVPGGSRGGRGTS